MRATRSLAILLAGCLVAELAVAERVTPTDRVRNSVTIREGPSSQSAEVGRLRPGDSLEFVRNVPRYRELIRTNGEHGFVSKSFTRVIRDAAAGLAPRQDDELRVHFLNIGAGTCTVVECPGANDPRPLVIDCGSLGGTSNDMSESEATAYIREILEASGAPPNLVLSHADRDHYGWIATVLEDVQMGHIWQGGDPDDYTADDFPEWLADQVTGGAAVRDDFATGFHNQGAPITDGPTCGDAAVFVLTVNVAGSKNANSLVLAIDYEDFSVTFTGDAEGDTERSARSNFEEAVQTTVLSGSHHGSSSHGSNGSGWAEASFPDVVVFSAGRKFGHPRCNVVSRFVESLSPASPHPVRCGLNNTRYRSTQISTRAEYMTEFNGRIVITSDGRSPLLLHCTGSRGCSTEIAH